jgi:hypothetical protein
VTELDKIGLPKESACNQADGTICCGAADIQRDGRIAEARARRNRK